MLLNNKSKTMKIGILTFHIARNYGAVLQCFALQSYLQELGHNVEVVNYCPKYLIDPYTRINKFRPFNGSRRLYLLRLLLWFRNCVKFYLKRRKYINNFKSFSSKYLTVSKALANPKTELDYDYCIIGSDQVWNPIITHGLDKMYWGGVRSRAKLITYAASSAFYNFTEDQKISINKYLMRFANISVREQDLHTYLKSSFDVDSSLVCDPTQLIDIQRWKDIAVKPKMDKYILAYFSEPKTLQLAKEIAKKRGGQVVAIYNIYSNSCGSIASPEEFVGLFIYADFVVSSSLHGLLFSLIFKKEFCIIGSGDDSDSRFLSVLNRYGIEDRIIYKYSDINRISNEKIDYDRVHLAMDEFRQNSRDYLRERFSNKFD